MGRKRPRSFEGRKFGSLERVVTALVEAGLQDCAAAPPNLVKRLRELERNAATGGDRQVLQVIASGRRLLGDEQTVIDPRLLTDDGMAGMPIEGQRGLGRPCGGEHGSGGLIGRNVRHGPA